MTLAALSLEPVLPPARGPLSLAVIELLTERAPRTHFAPVEAPLRDSDPYGIDMQLALHICYELHYRGFAGVDPGWEWNPALLSLRAQFENEFLSAISHSVGVIEPDSGVTAELTRLTALARTGPIEYLRSEGTWRQMQEYFIHRSLYRLRESDPQTWVVPRHCGCRESVRQQSFAILMAKAGLDATYLAYLDRLPAQSLAVGNLMTLLGLHRAQRGAAAGFFAAAEASFAQTSRILLDAMRHVNAPAACTEFYRDYIENDAPREHSETHAAVSALALREPHLDHDVIFGIRAQQVLETMRAEHLVSSWSAGRSSLRR